MVDEQQEIDLEIRVLIDEGIKSTECIWGWAEVPTGDVVVFLCDKELAQEIRPIDRSLGETVGQGRTFVFAIENGQWTQVATGSWGGGLLRLEMCFASLEASQSTPKWKLGKELCQKWRMCKLDEPNQADIDEILERIDSVSYPDPIWLNFRSQFIVWVRHRGLLA